MNNDQVAQRNIIGVLQEPSQNDSNRIGNVVYSGSESKKNNIGNAIEPVQNTLSEVDPEEEKEIVETKKKYKLTPKFQRWAELVLDKENKKTFGNFTQSAIIAYNLDPKKQYNSAFVIGRENYRKLNNMSAQYAELKGVSFGTIMDTISVRALTNENRSWMDLYLDMTGIRSMVPDKNAGTTNVQINNFALDAQEIRTLNSDFVSFLDQKHPKTQNTA